MAALRRTADEWRDIVDDWLASGQSKEEYARALGVSPITLGWWRWKLGVPAQAAASRPMEPHFAEVVLVDNEVEVHETPDFVIELRELRVRVSPGFDAPELRRLLATLC